MITGLGKYVLKLYGKNMAGAMFTTDHFRAIKGWRYDMASGLFHTPEMRQIKSNLRFDNNLKAISILQSIEKEEPPSRVDDRRIYPNMHPLFCLITS